MQPQLPDHLKQKLPAMHILIGLWIATITVLMLILVTMLSFDPGPACVGNACLDSGWKAFYEG